MLPDEKVIKHFNTVFKTLDHMRPNKTKTYQKMEKDTVSRINRIVKYNDGLDLKLEDLGFNQMLDILEALTSAQKGNN